MDADSNKNNSIDNIPKLTWACRRGMLELDVLLANFLKDKYPSLPSEEKELFVRLLDQTDPQLFAWLMGSEIPSDPDMAAIIALVRHHANAKL